MLSDTLSESDIIKFCVVCIFSPRGICFDGHIKCVFHFPLLNWRTIHHALLLAVCSANLLNSMDLLLEMMNILHIVVFFLVFPLNVPLVEKLFNLVMIIQFRNVYPLMAYTGVRIWMWVEITPPPSVRPRVVPFTKSTVTLCMLLLTPHVK